MFVVLVLIRNGLLSRIFSINLDKRKPHVLYMLYTGKKVTNNVHYYLVTASIYVRT